MTSPTLMGLFILAATTTTQRCKKQKQFAQTKLGAEKISTKQLRAKKRSETCKNMQKCTKISKSCKMHKNMQKMFKHVQKNMQNPK